MKHCQIQHFTDYHGECMKLPTKRISDVEVYICMLYGLTEIIWHIKDKGKQDIFTKNFERSIEDKVHLEYLTSVVYVKNETFWKAK